MHSSCTIIVEIFVGCNFIWISNFIFFKLNFVGFLFMVLCNRRRLNVTLTGYSRVNFVVFVTNENNFISAHVCNNPFVYVFYLPIIIINNLVLYTLYMYM